MLNAEHFDLATAHRDELLAEAERDRLADRIPSGPSVAARARHALASLCVRLAAWLDEPPGYVQMPEAGPEDWVAPWVSV